MLGHESVFVLVYWDMSVCVTVQLVFVGHEQVSVLVSERGYLCWCVLRHECVCVGFWGMSVCVGVRWGMSACVLGQECV